MTNFEKWKAGLTAEEILNAVKRVQKVGRSNRFCCFCPAQYTCHAVNDEECNEHITAWANAEAEEEQSERHNIKVKVVRCSHQWSGSDVADEVNKALAELQPFRIIDIKPMMSEYELFYTIIYDKQ